MNTSILLPRRATLDGFRADTSHAEGVNLLDLDPLTTLLVRTCNTRYRITISSGTTVFVRGGRFFPETTVGQLNGSSAGGSFLKLAWIGVGLCMEILADGRRIITSPVREIATERQPSSLPH